MEKALALAHKVAKNTPLTNYAILQVLPRVAEANRESGLLLESMIASITQSTPEVKERVERFLNRNRGK